MRTLPRNGLNSLIKCSCFEYLIGYFFVGHKVTHFWFRGRMFCLIKSFSQLSIVNKRLKQTVKQDGRNFFDVGHRRQFFRQLTKVLPCEKLCPAKILSGKAMSDKIYLRLKCIVNSITSYCFGIYLPFTILDSALIAIQTFYSIVALSCFYLLHPAIIFIDTLLIIGDSIS